jgi:hypothetical protein
LTAQPNPFGNVGNAYRLAQHVADGLVLLTRIAGLAAAIGVSVRLGVLDTGPLRFLRRLGVSLGRRSHEGNQRVPDGHLDRVCGRAVERHVVDYRTDYDTTPHKLPNGVSDISIVAAEAVDPAHDQSVARAEDIKQPPAVLAFSKLGGYARRGVVLDSLIDMKAGRPRLRLLVYSGSFGNLDGGRSRTTDLGHR